MHYLCVCICHVFEFEYSGENGKGGIREKGYEKADMRKQVEVWTLFTEIIWDCGNFMPGLQHLFSF